MAQPLEKIGPYAYADHHERQFLFQMINAHRYTSVHGWHSRLVTVSDESEAQPPAIWPSFSSIQHFNVETLQGGPKMATFLAESIWSYCNERVHFLAHPVRYGALPWEDTLEG